NRMVLSLLGSATCSVPDCGRTELRTMLAIAFRDRTDRTMRPVASRRSPTLLSGGVLNAKLLCSLTGRGKKQASLEGSFCRCFQQNIPAPDDVDGRENDGDEQGVPDTAGTETGQVHHAVGKSVRCIDEIDEKGPSCKPHKSIADCHMEGRRDGFGEKSGNAAGFGAIEGEQIIQVIEDDERIVDGADQEKQTEKPDIM